MTRTLALLVWLLPAAAHAQLPHGWRYDDGFARFGLQNRSSVTNNVPTAAWVPSASLRVLGQGIPAGSAFKVVYRKGRQELGTTVCNGVATYRVPFTPENRPDELSVAGCTDHGLRIQEHGLIEVDVYLVDDSTDEEHLARRHVLDVRRLTQVRSTGQPGTDHFVINHHPQTAVMLIDQVRRHHAQAFGALSGRAAAGASRNEVWVYVSRSSGDGPPGLTLRCSVDGQRLELPFDQVEHANHSNLGRHTQTASEIRLAARNRTEGDHVSFRTDALRLPITFGSGEDAGSNQVRLDDHPGAWECELRAPDRRVARRFRFVVRDATIQPHAEETGGESPLAFPEGVHLLDVDVPEDSPVDVRTDPQATRAGAFYGRAWQTDAGRAMGARIPALGDAFPPSGRTAPAAGRAARRRR